MIRLKKILTEEFTNKDYGGPAHDAFDDTLHELDTIDDDFMSEPKWKKFNDELSNLAFYTFDGDRANQIKKVEKAIDDLVVLYTDRHNKRIKDSIKKLKKAAENLKKRIQD